MGLEDRIEKPTEVATAVPYHSKKEKFLLAKRNEETEVQPGKWNFPGGKIETETPKDAALRELREETGLNGKVLRTGESFTLDTEDRKFEVHPFLVLVAGEPELNSEHTGFEWIEPVDLEDFDTVKGLREDLRKVGVLDA